MYLPFCIPLDYLILISRQKRTCKLGNTCRLLISLDLLCLRYYNNDTTMPIFKSSKSWEQLARLLVVDHPSEDVICRCQPVNINHNVSFVVDLESLKSPDDLKADENGS